MARTQASHPARLNLPPHRPVAVLDPDSESGRRIAAEMGELIADVEDRLARDAAQASIRKPA
jgi:hypothetical protein